MRFLILSRRYSSKKKATKRTLDPLTSDGKLVSWNCGTGGFSAVSAFEKEPSSIDYCSPLLDWFANANLTTSTRYTSDTTKTAVLCCLLSCSLLASVCKGGFPLTKSSSSSSPSQRCRVERLGCAHQDGRTNTDNRQCSHSPMHADCCLRDTEVLASAVDSVFPYIQSCSFGLTREGIPDCVGSATWTETSAIRTFFAKELFILNHFCFVSKKCFIFVLVSLLWKGNKSRVTILPLSVESVIARIVMGKLRNLFLIR